MTGFKSSIFAALHMMRAANRDVFSRRRLSLLVIAFTFGPAILLVISLQVMSGPLLAMRYRPTFFDPDGTGDPVFLQNVLWFAGHPETALLIMGAAAVLWSGWGMAIWWRAQTGPTRLRVPVLAVLIISALLWGPEALASLAYAGGYAVFGMESWPSLVIDLTFGFLATAITLGLSLAMVQAAQSMPVSLRAAHQSTKGRWVQIGLLAVMLGALYMLGHALVFLLEDVARGLSLRTNQNGAGWARIPLELLPYLAQGLVWGWLLVLQAALIWSLADGCLEEV